MRTLYDGSWWLTRSRSRGIGMYLRAYTTQHDKTPRQQQWWFFPRPLTMEERSAFLGTFGHDIHLIESSSGSPHDLRTTLRSTIKKNVITSAVIGSPFEQPWSLLLLWPDLHRLRVKVSVIIHDLIPLRYRREVLQRWRLEDQRNYQRLISYVKQVEHVACTSSFSAKDVREQLHLSESRIVVIPFGEKSKWIRLPPHHTLEDAAKPRHPIALTISGGDWRKNLAGTIEYYAQNLANTHHLIVICKLSWKEHIRYRLLAWRLGVGTRVQFLGEVDEIIKWKTLRAADTFLFLSRAEGLGIPLLEARKAGVRNYVLSEELFREGFHKLLPKNARVTSASFYDRYHQKNRGFTKIISRNNFTYFYILEFLEKHFPSVAGKKILDVGCGVGTLALFWAKNGAHITGIDVSPRAVQLAKVAAKATKLDQRAEFRCEYLGQGRGMYDLVTCTEVIEHVPNEAQFLKFAASHVKSGGALMLTTPSSLHWLYRLGFYTKFDREVGHLRRYTPTQLKEKITAAGFRVVEIRGVEGPIRSFLFTTRFGELIRFIRGPAIPLFHLFDRATIPFFGASGWQVWAMKK